MSRFVVDKRSRDTRGYFDIVSKCALSQEPMRGLTEAENLRTEDPPVLHDLLDRSQQTRIDQIPQPFRRSSSRHETLHRSQEVLE